LHLAVAPVAPTNKASGVQPQQLLCEAVAPVAPTNKASGVQPQQLICEAVAPVAPTNKASGVQPQQLPAVAAGHREEGPIGRAKARHCTELIALN